MRRSSAHYASRRSQHGVTLVLITIALTALIAMAGLALDVGHMLLSKARLQNMVDAAALSAAKILDETSSTALATQAAFQAFGLNAAAAGDQEIGTSYTNGSTQVTVQYSSTLPPFTPGSATGPYVRVIATGFTFPTWLVEVIGINRLGASASAVAGPSPTIGTVCNVAPMMVCGKGTGAPPLYGYTEDAPVALKSSAPGSPNLGPGNFQLIQLGGPGGNDVRSNLAGGYRTCQNIGNTVQTQTGNETGPTVQGLNTRFGQYSGTLTPAQYPPDVLTDPQSSPLWVDSSGNVMYGSSTQVTSSNIASVTAMAGMLDYETYSSELEDPSTYNNPLPPTGDGVPQRRVLSVPIGDCSTTASGSTSVTILGFGCFFLLQPVYQMGTNDYVIGQFEGQCPMDGTAGPNPNSGPGPYVIELYHDPGSGDS